MQLIDDARAVARRAWSMRFIYVSVVLGAVDAAMPFFAPEKPSRAFGLLAVATTIAAGIARLVAQPRTLRRRRDADDC
jgi:hypothetical protein